MRENECSGWVRAGDGISALAEADRVGARGPSGGEAEVGEGLGDALLGDGRSVGGGRCPAEVAVGGDDEAEVDGAVAREAEVEGSAAIGEGAEDVGALEGRARRRAQGCGRVWGSMSMWIAGRGASRTAG